MDADRELGDFLRSRRADVVPASTDDPRSRRRVPGLRREEVASASGVSVDYYTRLEQGRDRHPSPQVLRALAGPLRIDDAELRYLTRLASGPPPRSRSRQAGIRAGLRDLLERLDDVPALIINRRRDVLAANRLAGLLCPAYRADANIARFVFCDERARRIYVDWDEVALQCVGSLRSALADDRDDDALRSMIEELSAIGTGFDEAWRQLNVREKTEGLWRFRHPSVGTISLAYETLTANGEPDQILVTYRPRPGSVDERSLAALARLETS